MSIRCRALVSTVRASFLVLWICLCCFPGFIVGVIVTLDSIQIFRTHELLIPPTIYFKCNDENRTVLPDVKKKNVVYTFKGEESWQPLTEIGSRKCKRCGLYALHTIQPDDVFDEWEFCPSQFKNGKYSHGKDDEFKATFSCPKCIFHVSNEKPAPETETSHEDDEDKGIHIAILVAITIASIILGSTLIVAIVKSIRNWRTKKRQEEQAQFLKLFEDGDDIEDELGLGTIV